MDSYIIRKRAFTLIELLVVIAIIAILAAILFPVFAQAKLSAKKAMNMSNMKQAGLCMLLYAPDYDDSIFPQSALDDQTPQRTRWWHGGLSCPSSNTAMWACRYDPARGLLMPYSKNSQILQDPAAKDYPGTTLYENGDLQPAYSVNPKLVRDLIGAAAFQQAFFSDMQEPASTMIMLDGISLYNTTTAASKIWWLYSPCWFSSATATTCSDYGTSTSTTQSYAVRFQGRYMGKGTVLWADGHVTMVTPTYRSLGVGAPATRLLQKSKAIGALSKVALPENIVASDPMIPQYNYYFSLNKSTGN